MLGPMNIGSETAADFFSPIRQTSIFERARMRRAKTVSYTADGRLLLDGQLAEQDTPEEKWQDLIYRALLFRLISKVKKDVHGKHAWVKHVKKSSSLREPMRLYQYDDSGNDKVADVFITTIRIQDYKNDLQRRATR
uniref:PH_9 domain-containing protein n=1 Tax=Syphacia muris TaxID=451379 RepID=A0A0N5AGN8_9BILA